MNSEKEIHILIHLALQGNEDAFAEIYNLTKHDVYKTVYFLLGSKQEINEVVNEIYTQLWMSLGKYNFSSPFRNWLYGIIIRQVSNWRRKIWHYVKNIHKLQDLELHSPSIPEHVVEQNEIQDELIGTISKLSTKLRLVIILRYYQDFTFEEISDLLEIPVSTAKSRNRLALEKLREIHGNCVLEGRNMKNA